MSTFEYFAPQRSPGYGLSDPLTVGLSRRVNGVIAQLRREVWIVRLAVCCGFAGAVLLQAGLFCLFARLVLMLDAVVLSSEIASTSCMIVGAAMMLASRALSAPRSAAVASFG